MHPFSKPQSASFAAPVAEFVTSSKGTRFSRKKFKSDRRSRRSILLLRGYAPLCGLRAAGCELRAVGSELQAVGCGLWLRVAVAVAVCVCLCV